MNTVTIQTPRGDISLPLTGAQSIAFDLGEGLVDRVRGAFAVIGMRSEAESWAIRRSMLERVTERVEAANSGKSILDDDTPAAAELRGEQDALRRDVEEAWAVLQQVIDAARSAVGAD